MDSSESDDQLPEADLEQDHVLEGIAVHDLVRGSKASGLHAKGELPGPARGFLQANVVDQGSVVSGFFYEATEQSAATPISRSRLAGSRPVVVMTALNDEAAAVRQHMTGIRRRTDVPGIFADEGHIKDSAIPVVLAITGPGTVGAAIAATKFGSFYRPRAILFAGIAGGLRDNMQIGDVVIATSVYSYQGGKATGEGLECRPGAWRAKEPLVQLARQLALTKTWTNQLSAASGEAPPAVHFGPVASGDFVLDSRDSALAKWIRTHFNDAIAIEMEGGGAAHAGHVEDCPVLIIRGISDFADGRKAEADASGSQSVAAAHAAAFAVALIHAMQAG